MDETEVTNYNFVEFLNQVLPKLAVKDRVVKGNDDRLWLNLGTVFRGFEPIVFENGRFSLKDASYASYPVVRVTAFGEQAYAYFYKERLPSELEWLHAVGRTVDSAKRPANPDITQTRKQDDLEKEMSNWLSGYTDEGDTGPRSSYPVGPSQVPHPVTDFEPNRDGIRGLQENVSEWGVRHRFEPQEKPQRVILGGLRGSMVLGETLVAGVAQNPSGAFVDLGFRCDRDAKVLEKHPSPFSLTGS